MLKITEWLKINKLSLNVKKSKYIMLFKTVHKRSLPLKIKIDKTFIERAHTLNYSGLTMDEHLNWKNHVDNISNKC